MNVSSDKKVVFFGNYLEVLSELAEHLCVEYAVIESRMNNEQMRQFCFRKHIKLLSITHLDELSEMAGRWRQCYAVSASFGLLFKQRHIDWFLAIYNFHPGCLFHNRGRHPLPNAIARGHRTMALSVHQITDEAIDAGGLISRMEWVIDYRQNYQNNYQRLLAALPYMTADLCRQINAGWLPAWSIIPEPASYFQPLSKAQLDSIIQADSLERWQP